jgi:hypothetical protein
MNLDDSEITFYLDNSSQGAISFSGGVTSAGLIMPVCATYDNGSTGTFFNFGADSSFAGTKTAQGNQDENDKGDFYYAPPSGFLALCTDNLPAPSITGVDAPKNFNTLLYTGTGSARTVTGVGFDPDLIWIKNRGAAANNVVQDRVRGGGYRLSTNTDEIEGTDPNGMTAFATDGFTIGGTGGDASYNTGSGTYIAWNWKANGAGSANTDGVINSTVSANTTAGFSIVKYSGSAVNNNTVGHGLSQAPELWITKCLTAASTDWETFFTVVDGSVDFMRLNTDAIDGDSGRTAPTASVFYVGTGNNQGADGEDYVAYCWHSVEGYSKVGKYVANYIADGTFIYTGFKPAWIMIKNVDNVANWVMQDNKISPTNPRNYVLLADTDGAEADWAAYPIDILSNGFKMRTTGQGTNGPMSSNFLYLAFAESPFKTSNAR